MSFELIAPPSGAVLQVDAYDVDGEDNEFRAHDAALVYLKDNGASSPANLTAANVYARPHMKVGDNENSILFNGVATRLNILTSDSRFAFIHQTGVFDLFLAFRWRGGGAGARYIIGNYGGDPDEKVFFVRINADGSVSVLIGNGAGQVVALDDNFELRVPFLTPTLLHVRGDGTNLKVSRNLFDYETLAFTGALGVGDAARAYVLGASGPTTLVTNNDFFHGDLFFASLYTSNLSAANLVTMRAALRSRAGSQA